MENRTCNRCGVGISIVRADARFCSGRCRAAWNRSKGKLPERLTGLDRWIRRSSEKVPLTVAGKFASSTNSRTWSSYGEAVKSKVGAGLGFVLNGDGIGCYDLDHCMTEGVPSTEARAFLAAHNAFYVEVSPSGDGLHAWVDADPGPGYRRVANGLNVEFYTQGRYITVSGAAFNA